MLVRLALEHEAELIVEMAAINAAQTKPEHVFNPDRVREVFASYIAGADPTIWVVEDRNRAVVGFLSAGICAYDFTDGIFTTQKVLFVRPESRGSRAAAVLMRHLIEWSKRLGAKEIVGGNDNGFNSERTARFLEHFGFRRVGYAMTLGLGDGRQERRQQPGSGAGAG